jgi:hypothetical protein
MPTLDKTQASAIKRLMVYGPTKSGKTLLTGGLAEKYNLWWFDLENGHDTLYQLPLEWQQRIHLIKLPDTRDFPIAAETCLKVVRAKNATSICDAHGKVACQLCKREEAPITIFDPSTFTEKDIVVFDSSTQLSSSIIAHITKKEADDYKLDYDDWGNLGKLLDIFFSHIQNSPYHVVVISHETNAKLEEKGKESLVPVAGTRNFSRNVGKYFDEIIYCQRKNRKHIFASSTTWNSAILTGSRHSIKLEESKNLIKLGADILMPSLIPVFEATTPKSANTSDAEAKKILTGLSGVAFRK